MKSVDLRLLLTKGSSRSLFVVISIASVIWALIVVCNALLLASIITGLIEKKSGIQTQIIYLACLWIFRSVFLPGFENWCSIKASEIKNSFRNEITSNISKYKQQSPAHLTSLLVKGLNSLDIYIGRFFPQMVFAVTTPITVLIVMERLDLLSSVIAFVTLPLIPFFGALIGKYTNDSVSNKWKTLGTLSKYFEDSLRGFVTLRIFKRESTQANRIKEMGDRYTDETMKVLKVSFLSALVLELCATISVALIAVSVGLRLVDSKIAFYNALAVLILAPEVYFPIRNAASLFHASADGSAVLQQIREIKEEEPGVVQRAYEFNELKTLQWSKWELKIPGLISSTIPGYKLSAGEVVAIVGDSGVGKTSFTHNLLAHTFTADVLVNNEILITPELTGAWQRKIGWIPQNPKLFSGTVRDQFTLLNGDISDSKIAELLAELSLNVSDLPKGLNSSIGSGGEKSEELSGGQIRKVAIGRALLRDPFLIIADEPTADLDDESVVQIMKALRSRVKDGATLLLITHDTSVLLPQDQVIEVSRSFA